MSIPKTEPTDYLNERGYEKSIADVIGRDNIPDPNVITTRIRTTLAVAGLIAHKAGMTAAGTAGYVLNLVGDGVDGLAARVKDRRTEEGERLDPLEDKMTNTMYLTYLALQHPDKPHFIVAALASVGVDVVSQAQRGSLIGQVREWVRITVDPGSATPVDKSKDAQNTRAANWWGKGKMALQSAAIGTGLLAAEYGDEESMMWGATAGLVVATGLGVRGVAQRIFKGKQAEK